MDCARARKLMPLTSGPLDAAPGRGDVTEATRASVLAHVEACAACRAEFGAYRRAAEALASVREVPEPPGGWAGIWAGIAEHVASGGAEAPARPGADSRPAWGWGARLARLAAVLLVACTVGFTAYHLAGVRAPLDAPSANDFVRDVGPDSRAPWRPGPSTMDAAAWQERIGLGDLHPQPGKGWMIRRVLPESPAFRSGLRPDDILESVNGAALPPSAEELNELLQRHFEQSEIRVRVLRGGAEQELVLRLQQKQKQDPEQKKE